MYRVLLVDDDMIVRIFLKNIVQWNQYGFEVCGTARDGEEALALYETEQPDLILTDVSMPQIDGIELIRRLRQRGFEGVMIILSCHDDFELVKNAMKEGADDYLLKNHIEEGNMGTLLNMLREKVDSRCVQSEQKQFMKSLAERGLRSAQHDLLTDILSGELSGQGLEKRLGLAGLHGKYRRLAVIFIQPIDADREQTALFFSLCEQRMQGEDAETLLLNDNVLTLLVDLTEMPSVQEISHLLTRLQNMIQAIAEQYLNITIGLACSAVCDGQGACNHALRQAWDMLQHGFYGAGRWQYGETPVMTTECTPEMNAFEADLPKQLSEWDRQTIQKKWKDVLESARRHLLSQGTLLSWLRRCDHAAGVTRPESIYSKLSRSLDDYNTCVEDYIARGMALRETRIPDTAGEAVRKAVQFMRTHYHEPIGLEQVAQAVGLTAGYLSARFKKEMGIGFSEYLLDIRLSHVTGALKDSDMTVKALSERAGFQDYSYFCKAFKKKMGVSPKEYRQALDNK